MKRPPRPAPRPLPPRATVADIINRYNPAYRPERPYVPPPPPPVAQTMADRICAALGQLGRAGGVAELARRMNEDPQAISKILSRLVKRGIVHSGPAVPGKDKPRIYWVETLK